MEFVVAEKRLCFAALLETMFKSFGVERLSQLDIAEYLGVTLPSNDLLLRKIENVKLSDNPYDWGMNPNHKELETLLLKEGINIEFQYIPAKSQEDWSFEDWIRTEINSSNIICTLEYNTTFDIADKNLYGHAILLNRVDGEAVEIFDPGPENAGIKKVPFYELFVASKRMNGGLWIFKR